MKLVISFIFLICICSISNAQKHWEMIDNGSYSILKIQKEAAKYFKNKNKGKGSGYKQYKRWEYFALKDADQNNSINWRNRADIEVHKFKKKAKLKGHSFTNRKKELWTELGPSVRNPTSSWNPGLGRIECISVDPSNSQHILTGSPTGGAWSTLDGGSSWTPLTDHLSTLDILSVSISPHNNQTYFIGTNNGIYKSIKYANKNNIPIPKDKKGAPPFSIDDNIFHTSTEGKVLENPKNSAPEFIYQRTVSPKKAPDKLTRVSITFKSGDPIAVNGKNLKPEKLLEKLNNLAGKNGIGRVDLVENRFIGIKSRGVYETPGGTVLYQAHRAIESVTIDKEAAHEKERIMPAYAELVYNGYWFSKKRIKLQKIIDKKRNQVSGIVVLGLYKGNVIILSRKTKNKAYSMKKVSFEENKTFNKSKIEKFIKHHSKQLNKA